MKAMVLAAGRGERLKPLTDALPKPLLQAGGTTLIEHQLDKLRTAGITDIVINLHHLGHQIRELLGDGSDRGLNIVYSMEEELLETGGGIKQALPLLGDDPFLVVSADTWHDMDYSVMPSALEDGCLGLLVMVSNPAHHPGGDFSIDGEGWLGLEGNCLTYSGFSLLSPALVRDVDDQAFKLRKVFDPAIAGRRMRGLFHEGYWTDVGTVDRYESLLRDLG